MLKIVLHDRIIRADEFINVNSEASYNEQQVCWAIVVFIFATWDEEIRPRLARIRGVEPNTIMINEMGDLRTLRRAIIHNGGVVTASEYAKLKVMTDLCQPDAKLTFNHDQMHTLFVHVTRSIRATYYGTHRSPSRRARPGLHCRSGNLQPSVMWSKS